MQVEKLRRAVWLLKQPLTAMPEAAGAPVSDLFLWRRSADWETFFELTDIPGLFAGEGAQARDAVLSLFDRQGEFLGQQHLSLAPSRRQTLDISALVPASAGEMGTFCLFHTDTPPEVTRLSSFIAERGYVSYRYRQAPLRSYVHGNLDAIAQRPDGGRQLLGGSSFLSREYRLQHELTGPASYELAIVNPVSREMRIRCEAVSCSGGAQPRSQDVRLLPGGCHVFPVSLESSQSCRIVITSRLVMARPLVFRINHNQSDVFHG